MKKTIQKNVESDSGDIAAGDIDKSINTYNFNEDNDLRNTIDALNSLLQEEIRNEKFVKMSEDLIDYKKSIDTEEVIGLEKKLKNGGRDSQVKFALRVKEKFMKKLTRLEYYESAQKMYILFLSIIDVKFNTLIYPKIKKSDSEDIINNLVYEEIVNPLIKNLGINSILNASDIQGMIYFLTGNCHINWK